MRGIWPFEPTSDQNLQAVKLHRADVKGGTCSCSSVHDAKGEASLSSRISPKAPLYACIAWSALVERFVRRSKTGQVRNLQVERGCSRK